SGISESCQAIYTTAGREIDDTAGLVVDDVGAGIEILCTARIPGSGIGDRFVAGIEIDLTVENATRQVVDITCGGSSAEPDRNAAGGPDRTGIVERRRPASAEESRKIAARHNAASADVDGFRTGRCKFDTVSSGSRGIRAARQGDLDRP